MGPCQSRLCLFPLVILLPFFLSFSNVVYLILYMYVCSKNSNKVDKTNFVVLNLFIGLNSV